MQTILRLKYIVMDPTADVLLTASVDRSPGMILTLPALTMLTTCTMAYLLTMLRTLLTEARSRHGSISVMSVSRDWTDFAYMMAKAIDIKGQYDSAQEFNPRQQPKIAAHTSDEQEQVSRPGNCTKCDGSLCPYRVSQENECDASTVK